MDQYLCIATTFLSGRYHGKEWPPSPARLFQALVAGARTGSYRGHWSTVEPVLEALERLPAPEVLASASRNLPRYRIAVPNNDSDKAGREWSAGRPFDPAVLRTLKTVCPRELSNSSGKPHLYYLWRVKQGSVSLQGVRRLVSCLHTFGWGTDMAYAHSWSLNKKEKHALTQAPGYFHHVPARTGKLQQVPTAGYLQDLGAAYQRYCNRYKDGSVDPATRATKYAHEHYQVVGSIEISAAKFILRKLDNSSAPYAVPWALGMKVAAWMRHAAAEALRQEGYENDFINSYVLGHGTGHGRHMSFIPVPSIGTIYPDGAVRRVMLLEPPDSNGEIALLLQLKLSSSMLHRLRENGNGQRKTEPACRLLEAPRDNVWPYYTRTSAVWHSVTPVVLHGYNSAHGKLSLKKTEQLLYQAFEESGYPTQMIAQLLFQAAPYWAGTEGALTIRVPEHLKQWPRYHVSAHFNQPVCGPLVVGIGRHYGIGLFAAPRDKETS
jgi:CRISPR-associated protein Csb2